MKIDNFPKWPHYIFKNVLHNRTIYYFALVAFGGGMDIGNIVDHLII